MEYPRVVRTVLIGDSCCKFMDGTFNAIMDYPVQFTVYRRNGANLETL